MAATERVVRITFNSDNQARGLLAHFTKPGHELIFLGGGVNSGKTFLFGVTLDWRGRLRDDGRGGAETEQVGALLVNALGTFRTGIFDEVCRLFVNKLGREKPSFGHLPPVSWQRRWARQGIVIPSLPSYTGVMCTPDGVHVMVGSLHNAKSMEPFETQQFAWAWIEEAINNSLYANETIKERVRCSGGGRKNPDCAAYHHHTTTWVFNPPRGAHPYLFNKLDSLEMAAKPYYHALRDGERCGGCSYTIKGEGEEDQVFTKEHGPLLDHRGWPLLRQGVGQSVWVRSKTTDNAAHQNIGYRSGLASGMSAGTARRRLEGEIIRETEGGAYSDFSGANLHPVQYDPNRTLYVCMDFNLTPRAAVFVHQLNPGEYPTENTRQGVQHYGVFGEYFFAGEKSDRKFIEALVRGDRGSGCDIQPPYASEELRGLPENWRGLRAHNAPIIAFGDQRGGHRTAISDNLDSSWTVVDQVCQQLARYGKNVPETQPSPRARVDAVNAKLCNAFGIRSLWIDRRCEETIRDFEQVMWDEKGEALREWRRGSQGTEVHRTHLTDALGYCIAQLAPMGLDPKPDMPDLAAFGSAIEPPRMR